MQPRFVPPPYQDRLESGRLILRDGTTAELRLAQPADQGAVAEFFARLSPESRRRRFFSAAPPSAEQIAQLCDSSNPRSAVTFLVFRSDNGSPRVVATASYHARAHGAAEVAFAVDDAFQGKGLGTLLLERLALLAVRHGFTRFWAVTHADNKPMLDVFRDSGFTLKECYDGAEVEIDLSLVPTEAAVTRLEMRDRIATAASLRPFFLPRGVAVVGASRDPASIGYRIVEALHSAGFVGSVYPVNPKANTVGPFRAYPSVRELPEPVDLAVVAVPRSVVPEVVDECAARGVRALVVITAGYAEVGPEGRALQEQLARQVRAHGMRLIGPNCMGLLNADPAVRLNASFSPVFPPPGRIAMSSQSGALGLAILAAARNYGLGISTFVSVGNKADVSGNDLLQYWEEDPQTDVILLYLESFGNPRRFARIARRVGRRKPIVVLKSGRTQAGGRAAGSHTAALAASDTAVEALFHQTGVLRADTLEEMFDLALALGSQPLPRGRRVGIVTNAGGPGILCADACEAGGLVLPELSAALRASLAEHLPGSASLANPVDMIASATPEQYRQTVAAVLGSGEVDALIVIYIPVGLVQTEAVARAIQEGVVAARSARGAGCPVLACWMDAQAIRGQLDLGSEHIPAYAFPEAAARALAKAAAYAEWRSQPPGMVPEFADLDIQAARTVCDQALRQGGSGWLGAEEVRRVLSSFRLPVLPGGVARSADEAAEWAHSLGFPVAVKLASRSLVHKTEVGGVHLHLADAEAVRRAFRQIQERLAAAEKLDQMDGVLVQPMVAGGAEVMVGVIQDPLFGPLVAFGLGGIHVEILADVCFRVTPLTDRDAAEMVRSIRGARLLEGYRGHPPADRDALEEVLLRVSRLVEEIPLIQELDLNPIIALPPGQGCRIVDARIRLREDAGRGPG
ncbi:MAG: GNAT family N-acetyltransferase [Gemmataceae bacterium]|nr:GNAT family N-acetyltransferase [Gemmataceae bacterium]MDW8266138.1 GNAT family N-acetyltransferase [Gemmataceae bacterium]